MIDLHVVYERHATDLRRFALYLTGNPALADDLVADAFVRLWTSTSEIRTETVKAYLIAIVRNLFLNTRRREGRDVPLDDTHVVADVAASIEVQIEQREQLAHVRATLASLAEVDRSALLLRALHEMPYEEIARVLEISVAAARVKVHRARLRLASAVTGEKVLS
jgi:RNA polymerase sigma-70 factor (ECF subfamily)